MIKNMGIFTLWAMGRVLTFGIVVNMFREILPLLKNTGMGGFSVGRTEEQLEKRRKASREYHRRMRANPEGKKRLYASKKKYRDNNKEKAQERTRIWYERNRESLTAIRRRWPSRRPEVCRAINRRWYKTTLEHAIAEFKRGNIDIDELNRRIGESLIRLDERSKAAGCK